MTVFLWDAKQNFDIGGFGGSLGYAQRSGGIDGLSGAYVGVGLDVWGNFSEDDEGRSGGYNVNNPSSPFDLNDTGGGSALAANKNQVVVRGPEANNYNYLAGTGGKNYASWDGVGTVNDIADIASLTEALSFNSSAVRPDQDAGDFRRMILTLDENNLLTVAVQFGFGQPVNELFTTDLSNFTRPEQLRIGFAAATGGSTQVHELRNLEISATGISDSFYWDDGGADNLWSTAANWDPDNIPIDYKTVVFTDAYAATLTPQTVEVDYNNILLSGMTFSGSTTYTLTDEGQTIFLEFDSDTLDSGDTVVINVLNQGTGNANHTINTNLDFTDNGEIQNLVNQTLFLNGDININTNNLEIESFGTTELNGILSGSGNLTKSESGSLIVTNNNTYSGSTTISAGVLQLENAGGLGDTSADTSVSSGGTLSLAGGITTPIDEDLTIAGPGANGEGALNNLTANNSWTGGVTLTDNATIGTTAGNLTLTSGNNLDASGFDLTLDSNSQISVNRVITDSTGNSDVTKTGTGSTTFTQNNTYSGTTTVSEGTLTITNSGALGDTSNGTTVSSGGTLELSGGLTLAGGETFTVSGDGVAGKASIWSASGTNEIDGTVSVGTSGASFGADSGTTLALDGAISGSGSVTMTGGGTVQIASGANTFTGDLIIESGTTEYRGNGDRLVDSVAISVNSGATFDLSNFTETAGSLAGGGNVVVGSGALTVGGNNNSTTFSGVLSGTGDFTKQGTGSMTFSGTNTLTGEFTIQNGEVVLGTNNTFADSMGITLQNGGTLTTDGFSDTLGQLTINTDDGFGTGLGILDFNNTSGGLLTFDSANYVDGSFQIDDWIGNAGSTSSVSTTTGIFFAEPSITAEMTQLANATVFSGWGDAIWKDIGTGYELVPDISNFEEWDGEFNNSWGKGKKERENWNPNASTMPGDNIGSKVIFGDLDTGDKLVGIPNQGGGERILGNMIFSSTTGDYLIESEDTSSKLLTFDQSGTAKSYITVSGSGEHQIGGNNAPINLSLVDELEVVNNSSGTTGMTLGWNTASAEQIDTNGQTLTFSGTSQTVVNSQIIDTGSLIKNGGGSLRLNDANTYTGGTTLNDGTLQIANNSALGTGTVTVNGGTLESAGGSRTITNALTIAGDFSITGDSSVGGVETFTISGSFAGTLSAGQHTLTQGNDVDVILDTNRDFTGTGGLTKDGAGTLEIRSNDNTFSGGLVVDGGTVQVSQTGALTMGDTVTSENYLGSGNVTVNSGGTLDVDMAGNNNLTIAGGSTISNTGGTLDLSNTNTGTGTDFFLGDGTTAGILENSGGTTNITVGDDFVLEDNSELNVSGGSVNIDAAGTFVTQGGSGTGGSIDVNGGGALNVDLTTTGSGDGNAFTLGQNDSITVNGSTSSMDITAESGTSVNFNGTVNLTNEGVLTVTGGTTNLTSTMSFNGGGSGVPGTLQIVDGDLRIDEPLVANSPTLEMNTSGSQVITAPNTNSSIINLGTFEKSGSGDVTINANVSNIQADELNISGGTLINGANDQIANSTNLEIAAGATWNTGGFDEIVNTLTLTGDGISVLDMSSGDSIIQFSDSSNETWGANSTLYIDNWSGDNVNGGGTDQLLFASQGLDLSQFDKVIFRNPTTGPGPGLYEGKWIGDELVPVPEPSTYLGGALLLGALGFLERRRLKGWLKVLLEKSRN